MEWILDVTGLEDENYFNWTKTKNQHGKGRPWKT